MNHRAFQDAVARLRTAGVVLEDWLNVDGRTISHWASGTKRIPPVRVRQVQWLLQAEENRKARLAAGLVDCHWLERHNANFAARAEPSIEDVEAFTEELERHRSSCPTCLDGEAWASRNLPDPGPYPMAGLWLGLLARMPPPFMPAALGAAFLGGIVSLRVLFVVGFALVGGSGVAAAAALLGAGIVAAAAAALAGASGGLVIPLLRPWLKRLGPAGDYLTGIAVVWAYLVTLGLVAPVAFGERILEDDYLAFAPIYGAVLGAFGAFMHRREQSKSRKKRRA